MGIRQEWVVECEGDDCDEKYRAEFAESAKEAGYEARGEGWVNKRRVGWLCPYCEMMSRKAG